MKTKERILIILGAIILGIIIGFLSYYLVNRFGKTEPNLENTNEIDIYIDKINKFNEIFLNYDFNKLSSSENDPAEDWRCVKLDEELANQYIESFNDLYGLSSSLFVNLTIRAYRDGTESKSITLCKPLNCDVTPISKDLYHYKEEDGKKYLEIGEEGNFTSYELEEQDGKIKSNIPIVYCPTYID